ncbi:hypothetical protein [Chryseobacterium camelliae]|uniref:Uncharacterized protein n=1 Tax=Chryseobacterium camelliae TaxID=1265445 RepID=A0ABU0TIK6_9FLAO|nr:hypothetical protein [Chryseobacterium camelliae]MDQ1096892.1 hypothetical protein [Chryseobacterium camelliae]
MTLKNNEDKSFENRRTQKFLKTYGFYVHVISLRLAEIPAAKFPSLGGVAKIQRIFDGVVDKNPLLGICYPKVIEPV